MSVLPIRPNDDRPAFHLLGANLTYTLDDVDVVDTTGCGDAFSAGFVYAMLVRRPTYDAAVLGNAVAALVAQGLGSDHGDFDLATADAFCR